MLNRPIEHILRKRLGQHPTPLDTDALWAEVEPRLPQKHPILSFWKWMVFGLALIGGIYLLLPQSVEDELQVVALSAPLAVETASKTSTAPAPSPKRITTEAIAANAFTSQRAPEAPTSFTTAPTEITKLVSLKQAPVPSSVSPRINKPMVIADLPLQETTNTTTSRQSKIAIPFLPLPQAYEQVVSLYEHITFSLPQVIAQATNPPSNNPDATTAEIPPSMRQTEAIKNTETNEKESQRLALLESKERAKSERIVEKEAKRIATLKEKQAKAKAKEALRITMAEARAQKKHERDATNEAIRLATIEASKQKRKNKEENRRAQDREEVITKTERELRKKHSRQDWLQNREFAKADAINKKENARLESQRRLEALKAKKEQDKLTREILKRNKAKYAKADREARLNEIGQRRLKRMQNRLARQEARQIADALKANNEKPKSIRQKQSPYWTVEPGIAISIPSRSVNIAGDTPNESQVSVNDQYEKALEAFTLQGLIGYHRPSGFSLRTGITYNNINSKVESEFTTFGTESVQTVVAIIESPDGSRREQTGTVQVSTETKTTERYYNSVRSIDLPVLLGYRVDGTKWGLTVEGGPTFNLGSSGNAHLYDGVGNYRTVSGGHFRNKLTGPGFLANLGGAYSLSGQTMLTANLRIQGFGKGGFENPSSGYATKYTLIGIQLGYRVRF